ncbi:MAG: rod-binding protein [Spirochaetales bacterium]|nr:rod-binding protein [Spirochaetales bacterium]
MIIGNDTLTSMNRFSNSSAAQGRAAGVSAIERNANSGDDEKLKKASGDFEAIFIKQMLDSMRKTINKTSLLGGGMAEDIFEDMLYDKYAEKMSKTANFGLKEILYRQLSTNSSEIVIK